MKKKDHKPLTPKYGSGKLQNVLDGQRPHWDSKLLDIPDMFGRGPSETARIASEIFHRDGARSILELGGGQGRDTVFFAENGFSVHVIDYSESGIRLIRERAENIGLSGLVMASVHDVRLPLPFPDRSFDGCFAHMLYCMALTTAELEFLAGEVRRILKPGGFHVYTVRNTKDPHYGKGAQHGEDIYEMNGFIVHYFSRKKIDDLAKGYVVVNVEECEESRLPKKLFRVTLRKSV
jgi:SAM-dependent methyltransferase